MSSKQTFSIIAIIIFLLLVYSSLFIVTEGQSALLLRLGHLVKASNGQVGVYKPGLHVKWPFIEEVKIFNTRLQTLDIQSSRIVTAEKKDVLVDYYVKWRIANLPIYFTRTSGNDAQAQLLIQQRLNDSLRAEFGKRNITDVVTDARSEIMASLLTQANISAQTLGIQVVDVRIKRIDLPAEVSKSVFDRMRAERQRVATEHRSMGKAKAEAIRAAADANVTVTIAKATAQAAEIRAQGDSIAAKIYADAYSQNPSFYSFYRSMLAYSAIFANKNNDILVLKPDSQFFQYFNSPGVSAATTTKK